MLNVWTFKIPRCFVYFVEIFLFFQVVVAKGPCGLENSFHINFIVYFGLDEDIIILSFKLLFNSVELILIASVVKLVDFKGTQASFIILENDNSL